jgi:hypothetical protein
MKPNFIAGYGMRQRVAGSGGMPQRNGKIFGITLQKDYFTDIIIN